MDGQKQDWLVDTTKLSTKSQSEAALYTNSSNGTQTLQRNSRYSTAIGQSIGQTFNSIREGPIGGQGQGTSATTTNQYQYPPYSHVGHSEANSKSTYTRQAPKDVLSPRSQESEPSQHTPQIETYPNTVVDKSPASNKMNVNPSSYRPSTLSIRPNSGTTRINAGINLSLASNNSQAQSSHQKVTQTGSLNPGLHHHFGTAVTLQNPTGTPIGGLGNNSGGQTSRPESSNSSTTPTLPKSLGTATLPRNAHSGTRFNMQGPHQIPAPIDSTSANNAVSNTMNILTPVAQPIPAYNDMHVDASGGGEDEDNMEEAEKIEKEQTAHRESREIEEIFRVKESTRREFPHQKIVGSYLIGRTLGEGAFAKVKLALHYTSGQMVAVKVVSKDKVKLDQYMAKHFRRESRLQQMLVHPNTVRLFEVLETERFLYFVQEYCENGDLVQMISAKGRLTERETRFFIRQLVSAVEYMHRLGILHRDLKAENFLLSASHELKVTDFGLSTEYIITPPKTDQQNSTSTPFRIQGTLDRSARQTSNQAHPYITQGGNSALANAASANGIALSGMAQSGGHGRVCVMLHTQCGSPAYAAPEVLAHEPYCTEADVWSLGVNMFYMLSGQLPYMVEPFSMKKLLAKIRCQDIAPLPNGLSTECHDLLKKFLIPDKNSRITLDSAMRHPWLLKDGPINQVSTSKAQLVNGIDKVVLKYICTHPIQKLTTAPFPSQNTQGQGIPQQLFPATCFVYPSAMDVIAAVSSNMPSEYNAIYHLLLRRLQAYCTNKGITIIEFERRLELPASKLSNQPSASPKQVQQTQNEKPPETVHLSRPKQPSPVIPNLKTVIGEKELEGNTVRPKPDMQVAAESGKQQSSPARTSNEYVQMQQPFLKERGGARITNQNPAPRYAIQTEASRAHARGTTGPITVTAPVVHAQAQGGMREPETETTQVQQLTVSSQNSPGSLPPQDNTLHQFQRSPRQIGKPDAAVAGKYSLSNEVSQERKATTLPNLFRKTPKNPAPTTRVVPAWGRNGSAKTTPAGSEPSSMTGSDADVTMVAQGGIKTSASRNAAEKAAKTKVTSAKTSNKQRPYTIMNE